MKRERRTRRLDANQLAHRLVQQAIDGSGQRDDESHGSGSEAEPESDDRSPSN